MDLGKLFLHKPTGAIVKYLDYTTDHDMVKFIIVSGEIPELRSGQDEQAWVSIWWFDREFIKVDNELMEELWITK